jgi:hypothetical protein
MSDINTKVELMAKDIDYIKAGLDDIKTTLNTVIEQKADQKEVDELRANQSKIAWIVITAVILAVLGLVLKSTI